MRFYKLTAQNFLLATVVLFFSLSGFADVSYQGRIIKPNGTPLTANLVTFSILIQNPNGTCTLYSENQSVNMQSGDGLFSLSIGSGTRTDAGSTPFSSIFSDSVTIAPNSTCLAGYTKSSSDVLSLRIAFNDGGSDGPQYLDPVAINSVPHAMEAAAVAGVASSSVLRVSGATAPPLTATNYTDLLALINGTSSKYAVTSSNGAVSIPVFSGNPTAPTTGQIWYDSVGNTVKYFDGTTSQTFGTAGAGLSSLNGLNSNTQSFAVGTGGTSPAWSSSVATHTLNIPMASTSSVTAGLLSYADWTTFNNKQSSGNYITALTGDVTATGPGSVGATIANNAVTTSKLFANPGISRLVITDSTTGGTLAPISCGLNQFLTWTVTGWTCTTPGSITAAGALTFAAGGTNENVTLTPSGTGYTILNGNVGIGTTSPTSKLHIINTHSVAMGTEEIDNYTQSTYAIADTGMKEALSARATATHTSGVIGSIVSVLGLSKATGVGGEVNNQIAFFARNDVSTGASVDSTFGVMVNDGTGTSGPTNQYGVYVKQLTNATNNFAVYTAGTTKSYFGGNVGIGTQSPSTNLHIQGGGANTATRVMVDNYSTTAGYPPMMRFRQSNSNTPGTLVATINDQYLNETDFHGVDSNSSNFRQAAAMDVRQDGAAGVTWVPARFEFWTTRASDGAAAARLTIKNDGNVGIGTTSPGATLDVRRINETYGTSAIIATQTNNGSSGEVPSFIRAAITGVGFHNYTSSSFWNTGVLGYVPGGGHVATAGIFYTPEWNGTDYTTLGRVVRLIGSDELFIGRINQSDQSTSRADLVVTNGGNVGIGTADPGYTLHVVGTAGLSTGTAWTNASDIRLKDIQGDYQYGLDEVLQLHTVRYNYKKDNALGLPSDFTKTGFIAQEVQKVIPEAVNTRKDGYLELNVDPIHWAVVNAVKEMYHRFMDRFSSHDRAIASVNDKTARLEAENAQLKARADKAENENAEIKARLEKIEKALGSK